MRKEKKFSKIELLFMERGREANITYEEFAHAGWTTEDYLTYLGLCEEVHAATIFLHGYNRKADKGIKEFNKWQEELFSPILQNLFDWLSQFFEHRLGQAWKFSVLEPYVCYGSGLSLGSKERHLCNLVYTSSDDFRYQIERWITVRILGDIQQIMGDDPSKIPLSTLETVRSQLESAYYENTAPELPPDFNDCSSIQKWASAWEHYDSIEQNALITVEAIDEEIKKRADNLPEDYFDYSKDILYVYSGNPKCVSLHEVKSVTAIIPDANDSLCALNVNYCKECNQYFISYIEYECYMKEYKYLIAKIVRVDEENNNYSHDQLEMKERSQLMMSGYTVREGVLSESERHNILACLMNHGIFSKAKIIRYLERFININGQRKGNSPAVEKWRNDLAFVQEYKIQEQERIRIKEIIACSKLLRKV